ncbi:hypothetical protein [Ulvibacter litoralis]|uniref:Uncharacterized protein n=1 Tax=Ulvibacter litoralis TaxID=227084 RepID=A0A1G7GAF6_9FLAO|nr:hypothetical protein [Ulvibacter litoralis]GHC57067.1 hypothetical protein GCM10008083_22130 [Ulvibacter litoralis]SDE85055.1 hypothetical protein SAMN05421855_1036 [Ulvibacter litoralis]
MKKLIFIALTATFLTTSFTSCREQKSEKEALIEEMRDEGADIKVKKDDGETKIKMETDDKKVKIKTDDEGNTKIKETDMTDDN